MIYIGIDPGVKTGFAIWNSKLRSLYHVETITAHDVIFFLAKCKFTPTKMTASFASSLIVDGFCVVMEDARHRKWFGTKNVKEDRARLQGAGSIKRDCQIIEDACNDWGIPIMLVAPKNNMTKLSAAQFEKITGWKGRTSEHARDAAMLVFQYKPTKNNRL